MSDTLIENLPLDWGHYPSDTQEGWEMLCRAKAKFDAVERELARKDALLRRWHDSPMNSEELDALIADTERTCTCHPADNPPNPCAQKFALSECRPYDTVEHASWFLWYLFDSWSPYRGEIIAEVFWDCEHINLEA